MINAQMSLGQKKLGKQNVTQVSNELKKCAIYNIITLWHFGTLHLMYHLHQQLA